MVACRDPGANPISASSSATVSHTHVGGRSISWGDSEAIASSCASPSMIRYAVLFW